MTADETRKLDNSQCILLIRGCDPIIDKKFNTFGHSLFKETEDGGAPAYIHNIAQKTEKVTVLSEESLKYYQKKKESGEPVQILELSMEEVFSYEPVPKKIFSDEELEANRKAEKRMVQEIRQEKKSSNEIQTDDEKLSELLGSQPYNEEQLGEILQAVAGGLAYEKILLIADINYPAEKMKKLRLNYTKEEAT